MPDQNWVLLSVSVMIQKLQAGIFGELENDIIPKPKNK